MGFSTLLALAHSLVNGEFQWFHLLEQKNNITIKQQQHEESGKQA